MKFFHANLCNAEISQYTVVLMGSTYSLIYFRSVSCKWPEDNPERKPSDSVVCRRVALHCDRLVMVLHESQPLILPGYLIAFT